MTNSRKQCRAGQRCEAGTFAEAVDCQLHHSEVPLGVIAERAGIRESYLRTCASQYDETHNLQAKLLAPITIASGNYALLDFIERLVGRVAIRLPRGCAVADDDLFAAGARVASEMGDVFEEIRRAFEDKRITEDELARVNREVHEAHQALASLGDIVRRLAERSASASD